MLPTRQPLRYSLPESIVSPLAPRPIGEILPEVLARYGLEPAPASDNTTATQKNNLRRQRAAKGGSAAAWQHGREEKKVQPSRQLPLFSRR